MALNWGNIGSVVGGLASSLTAAGVSSTQLPNLMQQIGLLSNPNEAEELNICKQILIVSGNPVLVANLAMKLETENGLPAAAASLAASLGQPGVDIPTRVQQIETIIKAGG